MSQITPSSSNILGLTLDEEPSQRSQNADLDYILSRVTAGNVIIWAGLLDAYTAQSLLNKIGTTGRLIYTDTLKSRMARLQRSLKPSNHLIYVDSRLHLGRETADILISQRVFEFSSKPEAIFESFIKALKSGGVLIASENDHSLLSHYPLAEYLERQLLEIAGELRTQGLWDPYAGRKLYSLFREFDFRNLQIFSRPSQVVTGADPHQDMGDWEPWFQQLKHWKDQGKWKTEIDLDQFRQDIRVFFENPERFSYSPLITIEGTKPD